MRGAFGAPHRDTRSPCLINNFSWRRDCLESYTTRRCASSVRWSTKAGTAPQIARDKGAHGCGFSMQSRFANGGRLLAGRLYWFRDLK